MAQPPRLPPASSLLWQNPNPDYRPVTRPNRTSEEFDIGRRYVNTYSTPLPLRRGSSTYGHANGTPISSSVYQRTQPTSSMSHHEASFSPRLDYPSSSSPSSSVTASGSAAPAPAPRRKSVIPQSVPDHRVAPGYHLHPHYQQHQYHHQHHQHGQFQQPHNDSMQPFPSSNINHSTPTYAEEGGPKTTTSSRAILHLLPPPPPTPPTTMSLTNGSLRYSEDSRVLDKNNKRLRISRACQNCKSRKTRCDAIGAFPNEASRANQWERFEGEQNQGGADMIVVQPCTNCVRGGSECFYSKKQLKRGPSKGYIKELERRLDTLESTLEGRATSPKRTTESSSEEKGDEKVERREKRLTKLESVIASKSDQNIERKESCSRSSSPQQDNQGKSIDENTVPASKAPLPPPSISSDISRVPSLDGQAKIKRMDNFSNIKTTFLSSHLNHCIPVLDPANYTMVTELGINEGVLRRAMRLLVEPVEIEQKPLKSLLQTTSSKDQANSSSPTLNTLRTPSQRLQLVIGQALVGNQDHQTTKWSNSSRLSSLASSTDAILAKQKIAKVQMGMEADALMICYLDALRRGQANGAPLAAAVSKLTMIGTQSDEGLGRRVVAMIIDRWHAVAFNSPFHLPTNSVTLNNQSHSRLLNALPSASNSSDSVTSEILRGAMVFGLFREALEACHGVGEKISHADVEAMLYSMELDEGSDVAGSVDAYSPQTMKPAIRNALRAYHALYQLPRINIESAEAPVTVESVDQRLRLVEGIMCVGMSGTVIDSNFHIAKSYLGPFILSIVTTLLTWLSRIVTFLARQALLSKNPRSRLQTLEHLRRKIYDWLRLISPVSLYIDRPGDNCNFSLLHSRVAMFAHANVSYVAEIGNLGNEMDSFDGLTRSSPVRDDDVVIRREADGILDAFHDLGPLGLALSTTHHSDASALLKQSLQA